MDAKENRIYQIISILLIIGIVVLVLDVIVPRYSKPTPQKIIKEIDFSNPDWIEQYAERSIGVFGEDFFINTAFTYNVRSNKMIVTYASQNSVDEIREFYAALPGAELNERNDETSLNLTVMDQGQSVRIYNYFSPVSRVIELEINLEPDRAQLVISQLEEAFPDQVLAAVPELLEITSGDVFGGYVRYSYDELDPYTNPYLPIFSRGYYFSGTEEDFLELISALGAAHGEYRYDETQDTHYFRIQGWILSLGHFQTDSGETIASITIQADPSRQ
jgi:hypothetical protein